jgi:hypothetical protein
MKVIECEIPWGDSKEWKLGDWYPMPMGFMARDQDEYIIDGWKVFKLDPAIKPDSRMFGDIVPIDEWSDHTLIFSMALAICEMKNQRTMLK